MRGAGEGDGRGCSREDCPALGGCAQGHCPRCSSCGQAGPDFGHCSLHPWLDIASFTDVSSRQEKQLTIPSKGAEIR